MDKKLQTLIEDQINKELWSAYIYFDMAEYYRAKSLDGFHKWFEAQAKEEFEHAEKFAEFLQDLEVPFRLKAIAEPGKEYKDIREPLVYQCEHEALVTSLINNIHKVAVELGDSKVTNFIQWFIAEQMEEEKTAKELLSKYDLFGKDGGLGLYELDKELGKARN